MAELAAALVAHAGAAADTAGPSPTGVAVPSLMSTSHTHGATRPTLASPPAHGPAGSRNTHGAH